MAEPEHVQQLRKALDELGMVFDELFSPENAVTAKEATEVVMKRMGRERVLIMYADVGAVRLHRGLIDAGHYDDKPEAARKAKEEMDRSRFGFEQILSAVLQQVEATDGA